MENLVEIWYNQCTTNREFYTIMTQEEYIKQLENTIESLTTQIEHLRETVHYPTKKLFGQSSEKTKIDVQGQLGLFDEAEAYADANAPEPAYKDVAGYQRKKGKTTREVLTKNLEVIEVPCTLHEDEQNCPWCKTGLKPIGKEQVREEIQFIPAQVKLIRYIRYAYECPTCKEDGYAVISKAATPSPVMKQ